MPTLKLMILRPEVGLCGFEVTTVDEDTGATPSTTKYDYFVTKICEILTKKNNENK